MALLMELANYSLNQLDEVPEEQACTSIARKWGVPGAEARPKEPITSTHIQKESDFHGIKPTIYDPRNMKRMQEMQAKLTAMDPLIGFAQVIPPPSAIQMVDIKFGKHAFGSPLSFHLNAVDFNFGIFNDLSKNTDCTPSEIPNGTPNLPVLPLRFNEDTEKFAVAFSQPSQ